jgi:predicted N-acetyltransferase YhbS
MIADAEPGTPYVIDYASLADLPDIRDLCNLIFPELQDAPTPANLGRGTVWQDPLLLTAKDRQSHLLGYIATTSEAPLPLRWWQLNLLAVTPTAQHGGLGTALVKRVVELAKVARVDCLYGLCDQSIAGWYTHRGFSVTAAGAVLDAGCVLWEAEPNECFFTMALAIHRNPEIAMS